jgi:iron complex outermembrane receptor protein
MLYGSYNRGFKSGNFNTVSAADEPFDSEIIDAYEIGIKTMSLENRLRFNAAAFYYDYQNLQLAVLTGSFLTTQNAADSEIMGLDFDGEFLATDRLRVRFGASYLNTEYTKFPAAQCSSRSPAGITTQFPCDVSGNNLARTPELTLNIGLFYNIPTSVGEFDLSGTYAYNDGFFWEPDNRIEEPSYSLVNAEVSWTSTDSRWGASVYGRNLLDEEYAIWRTAFALGDAYAAAPPSQYGAEFRFKF